LFTDCSLRLKSGTQPSSVQAEIDMMTKTNSARFLGLK